MKFLAVVGDFVGNYKQHIGFAGVLGVIYAWAASALAGIPWLYATVAALLATMSGLLPDLDHPIGVELKGFTGILGVLVALAVWDHTTTNHREYVFEVQLWGVVLAYLAVRYGLRRTLARLMVHRGISHSIPTCAVWGAVAFLYYPSGYPLIRALMASAVMVGFLSHLVLDEICSVDLTGHRIKSSFGTAIKFWAPSPFATVGMYLILLMLSAKVIDRWPPNSILDETIEVPKLPPIPAWLKPTAIEDYIPASLRNLAPKPVSDDPSLSDRPSEEPSAGPTSRRKLFSK